MTVPRVLLVGGAPLVGKSTVARILAARTSRACLSTDDLAAAIRAVTTGESHPALHAMDGVDYREYYIVRSVEQLVADAERSHDALWPAVESVIRAHASWAGPVVMEGWALQPERVAALSGGDVMSVWLVTGRTVLEARLREDRALWEGASDAETLIARFVARSLDYDARTRSAAAALGLPVVEATAAAPADEIAATCLELLRRST